MPCQSAYTKTFFMKVKFLHFCVAIALWANITCANGQVNIQDSLALVDLYNSTNGQIGLTIQTG